MAHYDPDEFLKKAKRLVREHYNSMLPPTVDKLTEDNFYIVWFTKTLQNWKAMVSTTVENDTSYYEVTYNGLKKETYLDLYIKSTNVCIAD